MRTDIAALMLHEVSGHTLDHFRGSIAAAQRLGHTVWIRDIRDPNGDLHSIVASVSTPD